MHFFHNKPFPQVEERRLDHILNASARVDASTTKIEKKPPILLTHLAWLEQQLSLKTPKDVAVLDMALVAFWGMARLGELTAKDAQSYPPVLASDVRFEKAHWGSRAVLTIRHAKNGAPSRT